MRLDRKLKAECDIILYFDNIDKLIKDMELEAMYPAKESDDNAGIKAVGINSDVVFNRVVAKNTDRIKNAKKVKRVVGHLYEGLNDSGKTIIRTIYSNGKKKPDKKVANELGLTTHRVKYIRKFFTEETANRMGYA